MRLKSFAARSMKEAMQMVRDELGPDAVIVATRQSRKNGGTVRITAAMEEPANEGLETPEAPASAAHEVIARTLQHHGTPARIVERLATAARILSVEGPILALAAALDDGFRFAPLPEHGGGQPIMLVGPPGVGKTVCVAKLAARATVARQPLSVITTDTVRAGGIEQLAAFTRLMGLDLGTAGDAEALTAAVDACEPGGTVLIDSAGTNPFSQAEMTRLKTFVRATGAEPVLVLGAGADAVDCAQTAAAFAAIGASRLLVTRLDAARRLGGMLAAADAGRLRFCNVSITADVGKGLNPVNPVSLARLLMPQAAADHRKPAVAEAVT